MTKTYAVKITHANGKVEFDYNAFTTKADAYNRCAEIYRQYRGNPFYNIANIEVVETTLVH